MAKSESGGMRWQRTDYGRRKVADHEVRRIRLLTANGLTCREIQDEMGLYGVALSTIGKIARRDTFQWVTDHPEARLGTDEATKRSLERLAAALGKEPGMETLVGQIKGSLDAEAEPEESPEDILAEFMDKRVARANGMIEELKGDERPPELPPERE